MKLPNRTVLVVLHDALAACIVWFAAYSLRFNLTLPDPYLRYALLTVLWVVPLQAFVFWRFGLYRGLWRFASLPDLLRILRAVATAAVLVPVVLVLFRVDAVVPRSVLLLDPLMLILVMGGSRFAYRTWKDGRLGFSVTGAQPVLMLGAGTAADMLLRELARVPSPWRVVGLLDDDPLLKGRHLHGIPVLGRLDEVAARAQRLGVRHVILALPSASRELRRRVGEACVGAGLAVQTMPTLEDLMHGRVAVSALRSLELDDLLGRDPVQLDDAGLSAWLAPRSVLVTGAGGSIGSELARQLVRFRPRRLVLFEQSEYALYQLRLEFEATVRDVELVWIVGDVKDGPTMERVLAAYRPAVLFHAAAYKHVPLMEENPLEALRNNVLGTWVAARAAQAAGVEKFVLVSTDKAVEPTSVMGASKRLAELVCQAQQRAQGTRFVAVRFGNVLGSSGSVVPLFRAQIESGGPITVTHPDVTRYFMSIPEASRLVLQAGLMGEGGEIFLLDMGEPVKIVDLARLMLRLAGHTEAEIPITFTGLRPGEKLFEDLHSQRAGVEATSHIKLWRVREPVLDAEQMAQVLLDVKARIHAGDAAGVRDWLLRLVALDAVASAGPTPPAWRDMSPAS